MSKSGCWKLFYTIFKNTTQGIYDNLWKYDTADIFLKLEFMDGYMYYKCYIQTK